MRVSTPCLLGLSLLVTTSVCMGDQGVSAPCGDTSNINIFRAAIKYRPSKDVSIQQVMLALLKSNPKAFNDSNVNAFISGRVLKCPTLEQINAVSREDALKEIARQNAEWKEYGFSGIGARNKTQVAAVDVTAPEVAAVETTKISEQAPSEKIKEYNEIIDSANISDTDKNILHNFALTSEGDAYFSSLKNYILMGPTSASMVSPIAFAQDWGMVGASLSYNRAMSPHAKDGDGAAAVGMGFGDAVKYFGVATSVIIDSLTSRYGDSFAKNGTVAVQIFKMFPDYQAAVAVGSTNLVPWGDNKNDATSYYAVGTKAFNLTNMSKPLPLTLSAGFGTGAYVSTIEYRAKKDGKIMPFTSAGLKILPTVSLIGEWVSKEVDAGISWAPPVSVPLNVNVGVNNIGKWHNYPRTILASVAVGFDFTNLVTK